MISSNNGIAMKQNIGFIGLGVLGSAIAENFVNGSVNVLGFDVCEGARNKAEALGITLQESPEEVATHCDTLFTCLPNADALEQVLHSQSGVLNVKCENQTIVELSTLSVDDKMTFEAACIAAGRTPIDCPVSGNRIMALNKKLTAFFSGAESAYEPIQGILKLTCSKTHYVGDFGNGTKVKLCGNILNLVHNTVAAEAMVLAMKSGLNPKMFHEVISGSGSSSAMFEVRGGLMVDEDYQKEAMNLSIPLKDAKIISEHAASLYCPIPLYQVALQNYYAAAAQGLVEKDAAVVCQVLERAANHQRDT